MHFPLVRSILTMLAGIFPNYALQTALSKTAGVETHYIAPQDSKDFSVIGVCTVTINEN